MNFDNQQQEHSYGTGSTHPAKSRGGLLSVLLAAVVLLGGAVSLMGMLNIQLFHKLEEKPAVVFSREAPEAAAAKSIGDPTPMLGIRCETVSSFMQHYYGLPGGVYVTQVLGGGAAQSAGLSAGDVIVSFGGVPVEDPQQLASLVRSRQIGEAVTVVLAHAGEPRPVTVILQAEN